MRSLDTEREFAKWLLEVGEGRNGETVKLPERCYQQVQDPIEHTDFNTVTSQQFKGRAILTVTNEVSLELNSCVLERISEEILYKSVDTIVSEDKTD